MDQVARMEAENRRLADEMRRKEQEAAAQLAAQQNQKLDLKRTMISPSAGGGTPVLSVQAPGFSNNFTLTKSRNQIGRAPGNDIQIPDQTVSSSHAVIWNESGQLYVEDIGSTNGSLLNGMRVQGKLAFKHGDLLQLGNATLKLV
jgi:pSer/pThr/pTyr-binding forkhead associated (FHA) protein